MSTPTAEDDELTAGKIFALLTNYIESTSRAETAALKLSRLVDAQKARWQQKARAEGMEQAKSRVLRRTEIPADAKNPTRDYVVVLGEEIASFIDQDIAELKSQGEE